MCQNSIGISISWFNSAAAEAEDERGMSESPPFEIPVTHFGFGRNDKCTRRGAKQLGFQGYELFFFTAMFLLELMQRLSRQSIN